MGDVMGAALGAYIEGTIPLPVWERPFQWRLFSGVAAIGFVVPFLAISYPVLRAVRVNPIDAIRTRHLAARGGGLVPLLSRVRLPGGTFARMPFRNLLRAPRRLVLTAAGIAAAIAVLVAVTGLLDSYLATIERSEDELLGDRPQRLTVDLDGMQAAAGPEVAAVLQSPALAAGEPGLEVAAELRSPDDEFAITLQLIDFESALWRPTAIEGCLDPRRARAGPRREGGCRPRRRRRRLGRDAPPRAGAAPPASRSRRPRCPWSRSTRTRSAS